MIDDLIRLFREAGIEVPEQTGVEVEIKLRESYRGERVYIAGPKRPLRARQLAKLNMMKSRDLAVKSGLPLRTVQRIRNGK